MPPDEGSRPSCATPVTLLHLAAPNTYCHVPPPPPTAPSISSLRRASSNARSTRSFSGSHLTTMSLEEYETLPSSVRKKFFSSAERFHIAQQSTLDSLRRKGSLGGASLWTASSISTDHGPRRPSTSGGISFRRLHSRRSSNASEQISEEQARWYLNLPDKIRKQQFSRTEQISLAAQCKRALEDTAPVFAQDVFRRCLTSGRDGELTHTTTPDLRRSPAGTIDTDILEHEADTESHPTDEHASVPTADEMEVANSESRNEQSRSRLVTRATSPSSPIPDASSRMLRRRAHSLTPMTLPPPELIPPVPPLPLPYRSPVGIAPQPFGSALRSYSSMSDIKAYQQADVRKQLRQYLTPEKFDEALEFGFSLPEGEVAPSFFSPVKPTFPYPRQTPPLSYDSCEEDEENSSDSVETAGPRTPTTFSDSPNPAFPFIKPPSIDSGISLRQTFFSTLKPGKKSGADSGLADREMTIFISLTKGPEDGPPGLRPTTAGGVKVARRDPLALEALPVCEDPSGLQGAFAVQPAAKKKMGKGLKKVWRSLRGN